MKRILAISLMTVFGFSLIVSVAAQAQPRTKRKRVRSAAIEALYLAEPATPPARHFNLVQVDAVPIFDKGVGVTIERALSPRLMMGPYFSFSKLTGTGDSSVFEFKSDVMVFGASARYFLTDRFDLGSWYLQAGLGALRAATEGVGRYNGMPFATARHELTTFQYQTSLGFQFAGWELGDGAKLMANLGAGVTNAGLISAGAMMNSSGFMTIETTPKVGLLAVAAIGVLF